MEELGRYCGAQIASRASMASTGVYAGGDYGRGDGEAGVNRAPPPAQGMTASKDEVEEAPTIERDDPRLSMASASNNSPMEPTTILDDVFLDHLQAFTSDAAGLSAVSQLLDGGKRRFCKSCRKSLDTFRDFDGVLKTCRLCLRVRKKDTKRRRALRRKDARADDEKDGPVPKH